MNCLPGHKPWLLEFILNEECKLPRVPRMLYVLKAADHPCSTDDGSCAKLVFDGDLSITAIFTLQAFRAAEANEMSEENGLASLEGWDQSQILVKKYTLSLLMAKEKNKCQFLLEVDDFCLWCLTVGFKLPILPLSCMDMARVKYKACKLWLANRKKQLQASQEEVPKCSHHLYNSVSPLTKPLSEVKKQSPTQGQFRVIRVHSVDASNNLSQKVSEDDPKYDDEHPTTGHQVSTVSGCSVFSKLSKTEMDCTKPCAGTSTLVSSAKQIPEQTTETTTVRIADSVQADPEPRVLETHNNKEVKVTQVKQPCQGTSSTGQRQTNTADNDCGSGIEQTSGESPVNKQCSFDGSDGWSSIQDQSLTRFVREQLEPDGREKGATTGTDEKQSDCRQAFTLLHVSTLEDVCSVGESSTDGLRLSMDEDNDVVQTSATKTGEAGQQMISSAEEHQHLSACQREVCLEKASNTVLCNKRLLSAENMEHSSNQVGFRIVQPKQNEFQPHAEGRERSHQRCVAPPSSSVGTGDKKDNELKAKTVSIQVGLSLMMDGLESEGTAEGKIDSTAVETGHRKRTWTDLVESSQPEVSDFVFESWTCQSDGGQVSGEQMDDFDKDLLACVSSQQTSADKMESPSEYGKEKNVNLADQSTNRVCVHSTQIDEHPLKDSVSLPSLELSPVTADFPVMTPVGSEDELTVDESSQGAGKVEQSSRDSHVAAGEKWRDCVDSGSDREQLEKSSEDGLVLLDCNKSLSNVKEIIIVSSENDSTDDEAVGSSSDGVKKTKEKQSIGQCLEKGRLQETNDEVIEEKEEKRKNRSGADTDAKNKYSPRVLREIAHTDNEHRKKPNEMYVDETQSRTKSTSRRKPKVKISKPLKLHENFPKMPGWKEHSVKVASFPKMTKPSAEKNTLKGKRKKRLYNINATLEARSPEMEGSSYHPQKPTGLKFNERTEHRPHFTARCHPISVNDITQNGISGSQDRTISSLEASSTRFPDGNCVSESAGSEKWLENVADCHQSECGQSSLHNTQLLDDEDYSSGGLQDPIDGIQKLLLEEGMILKADSSLHAAVFPSDIKQSVDGYFRKSMFK